MRRTASLAGLAALTTAVLTACSSGESTPNHTVTAVPSSEGTSSEPPSSGTGTDTGTAKPSPREEGPPRVVDTIATRLATPWGLGFLPDGDAVVTERDTRQVLLIDAETHAVRPVGRLGDEVPPGEEGESGLLGVAVSPDFRNDRMLYFYQTTATDNRIVKARLEGNRLGSPEVILDGIPTGFIHDGGRLAFGPDGYLYASTGETGSPDIAQDRNGLAGKILRITTDGEPAPGNPLGNSPIWSYGHRNVQGLAFDDRDRLWASEFGQDTFDELNLIRPGGNYGWPIVEGRGGRDGLIDPQVVWRTDVASPSGLAWLDGRLWLASLRGARLWRIDVQGDRASHPADFFVGEYGRMRTVAVAPDGRLWVTTSNRDGRGAPTAQDDRILLVDPAT